MHKKGDAADSNTNVGVTSEPPDVPDKPLANVTHIQGRPCQAAKVVPTNSDNPLDIVPRTAIPG